MPRETQPRLPPRERILQAAETLFYQDGINRVTVDAIAERAESTKMTLYRHFSSKESLVLAWIELLIEDYSQVFDRLEAQTPGDPAAQILGFGQFIVGNLSGSLKRGCPFTNTLAETTGQYPEVREAIFAHKQRQFHRLVALCARAGASQPEAQAKEITLMLEGLQVVAQNSGFEGAADYVLEKLAAMLRQL
ncbi:MULTISPECIES: TetR/AcrR family transcriptional regulator [Pantoea]|jgi:AcrR family transcriptional regulator|uniref:TetR/AcrR family transcriptional regulator n=1 Tax=Pantoea TaxID=53335 RepID=UPI001F41F401|nr:MULTISPECIES: TetR/AcrR family transcriptional regulator [Pantoea]UIL54508.1 TetR/AcrR family transcriptional regulator [Pantoea agglomerans]